MRKELLFRESSAGGSGTQQLFVGVPFVLVDAFGPSLVLVDELGVIDAEQMEDRRVDVVNMQTIFDGIQTEIVGGTVGLAAFHAANTGVRLNVVIRNTHDVETAVVDGKVNVGLVEGPTQHPALIRRHIDDDEFVLVVAVSQRPPVDDDGRLDLRATSWVIREAGSGTRLGLEGMAQRASLSMEDLNIALVLPSNEAVREAIEAGAGATIISRHVVASSVAAGRLREIPIDLPRREFALVLHRDRHATLAQKALVDALTADARSRAMKE